ncbi:MAG: PAS domain S-box protein [Nitrospirae bacterium]|nr:PAS domain S-box protein [Nitrospirota bacterium]
MKDEDKSKIQSISEFAKKHSRVSQVEKPKTFYQHSGNNLEHLFDLSNDMLCITDLAGYFKQVNPAFKKILGYSDEELFSHPFYKLVHQDDNCATLTKVQEIQEGKGSPYFENRLLCKDGSQKWIGWNFNADKQEGLMYAVARDITEHKSAGEALKKAHDELQMRVKIHTLELERSNSELKNEIIERKKAEEALKESEELYRIRFEESPISLWDKDYSGIREYTERLRKEKGITDFTKYFKEHREALEHCATLIKVTDVNETTVKNYRAKDKPDFMNNIYKIFCEETWDCFMQECIYVAEGMGKREGEAVTLKFDGEPNNISVKWQIPQQYQGGYSRILFSIVDVTREKQAEKALRESESKFKKLSQEFNVLLDAIPDSLVLLSSDMTVMWGNKAAVAQWENDTTKLVGQYYNVFPLNDKYPLIKSFRTGREEAAEITTPDGRVWDIRAFPLKDEAGKARNVLELARDITVKVRMEEEAKFIQAKLVHANKMTSLGTLVSGVAHEINNPNSYIMSNAYLFSEIWNDAFRLLSEQYRQNGDFMLGGINFSELNSIVPKLLGGITDGTARINNIVDNLKNFARPDSAANKGKIDVNNIVNTAAAILEPHIKKCTDHFQIVYAEDMPCVKGNSQQLEQVVINLMMNSLQALPNKASGVRVSTLYDKKSGYAVIEVKDEGAGIPEDILERITEPFFTTKLDCGGTGLGLSISYSIVKEHKGVLDFQSKQGKGTTVSMKLPVYQEA